MDNFVLIWSFYHQCRLKGLGCAYDLFSISLPKPFSLQCCQNGQMMLKSCDLTDLHLLPGPPLHDLLPVPHPVPFSPEFPPELIHGLAQHGEAPELHVSEEGGGGASVLATGVAHV